MQLSTLLATFPLPILTLANPAAPVLPPLNGVTIPAVVPNPIASLAASALSALPLSISATRPANTTTSVALPTLAVPATPLSSDLIPGLAIPPSDALENVEAAQQIVGIVIALLTSATRAGGNEGIMFPGGQGGAVTVDGKLVATLVNQAVELLSSLEAAGADA